jgi:hypothetical protein
MNPRERGRDPLLVAVEMGYGHLRAAAALAAEGGLAVLEADRAPLADAAEEASWRRARTLYEGISRGTDLPLVGPAFRRALESLTDIPRLRTLKDLRPATPAVRMLRRMAERGLCAGVVRRLRETGAPLLATFYAPAVVAADAGLRGVTCVVTDVDVNRVWVPADPVASRVLYCVPSERTAARLRRYGVPEDRIEKTGFPLPPALTGGDDLVPLRGNLAARIRRLDVTGAFRERARDELLAQGFDVPPGPGEPPLVALLVGGAGAQVDAATEALAALGGGALRGRWRLALVAGVRRAVADVFREELARLGLDRCSAIEVLHAPDTTAYFAAMESLLARTDAVWTKPSEMTFYAALGLPLLLAEPLGVHERCNRRYVLSRGAAFDARTADRLLLRLTRGLADGSLANAAWNGFRSLPHHGARRILRACASNS